MRLISLNVCGGIILDPLMTFLKEQEPSTDVFCFQEIYTSPEGLVNNDGRTRLSKHLTTTLGDFTELFFPMQESFPLMPDGTPTEFRATFGQAIFIHESYKVLQSDSMFLYRDRNMFDGNDFTTFPTGFQYASIAGDDGLPLTVASVYGIPLPGNKLDTPERLIQSEKLKTFVQATQGPKIICGDFNLAPETQSIAILEKDMRNLIKEFRIKDTRGPVNAEKYAGKDLQKFADYTFVSPEVMVHSFTVPPVSISDHLPMILECSF